MKKKLIILALASVFSCIAIGSETDPFLNFRNEMDNYNKSIYYKKFTNHDALIWWNIMDRFLSTFLSETLKNAIPEDYFQQNADKTISGVKLSYSRDQWSSDVSSMGYHIARPPYGADQDFGVTIYQLDCGHEFYFAEYICGWFEDLQLGTSYSLITTFRLLKKNARTGKYEIVARNEDTNFYRRIIAAGKLKHRDYVKTPYSWIPMPLRESVKNDKSKLTFDIKYSLCPPMAPCYHDVTVTYIYANNKLVATKYRDYDQQASYSTQKGQYIPKDVTVKLAP